MLIIGLTGGIGCGKTTVSQLFENKGIPVVDADDISHAIVQKGKPALALLIDAFGDEILSPNGSLNRESLRELVFSEPKEKKKLENILHPLVFEAIYQQLEQYDTPYGILSIPLLFETHQQSKVDRILVIDCSEKLQKKRVASRNQFSYSMIDSIIRSQCSRSFRLSHADDILNNNVSFDNLKKEVEQLHNTYLKMSTGKKSLASHPAK